MSERTIVRVAAAILHRGDGKVLMAQRLPGTPYAGFWEFPGGKLEPGESAHDALLRELDEELGIVVTRAAPWLTQRYAYPHAHVELDFFRVFEWQGDPHGRDGQAIAWQDPARIEVAPLLPANAKVLRALALPPVYAISMAEDLGEETFLARARASLDAGLKLIQLREKSFAPERLRALAGRLLAMSAPHGARVLLNGDVDTARELGCAGVHWSAARLSAARSRPQDMLCAASTHDAAELAQAGEARRRLRRAGTGACDPVASGCASAGLAAFRRARHRLAAACLRAWRAHCRRPRCRDCARRARRCAAARGVALDPGRVSKLGLFRLRVVRVGIGAVFCHRNAIRLCGPGAQVDQLAAFGAKGPEAIFRCQIGGLAALRAARAASSSIGLAHANILRDSGAGRQPRRPQASAIASTLATCTASRPAPSLI